MVELMTDTTDPSDEEYSIPGDHHERYGLTQHHMGLDNWVSIKWSGSAYELIRDDIESAWQDLDPRGGALKCFTRINSGIRVQTFPEAKAIWGQITDELYRRQINDRQRNSLHRVRDELEEAFAEQVEGLEQRAARSYNGHLFRSEGEIPFPSVPADEVTLEADVTDDDYVRARVKYNLTGMGTRYDEDEVERVVADLPVMYGMDPID